MPYYSESESKELREGFEEIVLPWPDVTKKMMFGSPSYARGGTIFAMLVNGGIILTRLDEDRKAVLLNEPDAEYFVGHGRVIKKWIHIRIRDIADIGRYTPFIEASYRSAEG
jgi:TfoX/Sxy family transcriptional regulator of competence genes